MVIDLEKVNEETKINPGPEFILSEKDALISPGKEKPVSKLQELAR